MAIKDSLGDRMKNYYENAYRMYLTRRTPVIIRLDGCHFHTFTKGFKKPYDIVFKRAMWRTAQYLCENIQNARLAYVQSDEISILLIDYNKLTTSAWFDNNIQKMCSVSASMATMAFNKFFEEEIFNNSTNDDYSHIYSSRINKATFDARVFNLPVSEVCNYFIWRQQDATRNSISSLGRYHFSQKELDGVSSDKIQDKLKNEKDINWNDCPTFFKRGVCISRVKKEGFNSFWELDREIPIFTKDREYVEKNLEIEDS